MRKARDFVHSDRDGDLSTFSPIINRLGITFVDWLQSDGPAVRLFLYRLMVHQFHMIESVEAFQSQSNDAPRLLVDPNEEFKDARIVIMDGMCMFNLQDLRTVMMTYSCASCVSCAHKRSKSDFELTTNIGAILKSIRIIKEANAFKFWLNFQYYFEYKLLSSTKLKLVILTVRDEYLSLITSFLKKQSFPFHLILVTYKFQLSQLIHMPNVSFYRIKTAVRNDQQQLKRFRNVVYYSSPLDDSDKFQSWMMVDEICYDKYDGKTYAIPFV
jgi:hypothetical protein